VATGESRRYGGEWAPPTPEADDIISNIVTYFALRITHIQLILNGVHGNARTLSLRHLLYSLYLTCIVRSGIKKRGLGGQGTTPHEADDISNVNPYFALRHICFTRIY